MRVLIASVAQQVDAVYLPHLETLCGQDADADVSMVVIDDGLSARAVHAIRDAGGEVWKASPKPAGARYRVQEETHVWSVATFHWLAEEKQRLLDHARSYDAVLLVDSDLLLAPDTLALLLDADKPVIAGVFWTRWLPDMEAQPNVWLTQPYGDFPRLDVSPVPVRGLGACTLIRRAAIEAGAAFWPLVPGLPLWGMWQGEDRHFSVRCNRLGIDLWADSRCRIWHCYRPSDVQFIPEKLDLLSCKGEKTWQRKRRTA